MLARGKHTPRAGFPSTVPATNPPRSPARQERGGHASSSLSPRDPPQGHISSPFYTCLSALTSLQPTVRTWSVEQTAEPQREGGGGRAGGRDQPQTSYADLHNPWAQAGGW